MMLPDSKGYFDGFGGRFMPETLCRLYMNLRRNIREARSDKSLKKNLIII